MKTIDRAQVFRQYPMIRAHIRDFQGQFFDPEYNDPNDPMYDALSFEPQEPDYENIILMWRHEDIQAYVTDLTTELKAALSSLACTELVLMPMLRMDWFARAGLPDAELVRVRAWLRQIVGAPHYTEALSIPLEELEGMLDLVFWSARLDPDFPEHLFWVDNKERFCFFVCRYGNIHFLSLNKEFGINEQFWKERGWILGVDVDQFG